MDIPEVESIPNSTDCLVTTSVRNEGNAPGKVSMDLSNRIFATNGKDEVKEYRFKSDEMITPGGEAEKPDVPGTPENPNDTDKGPDTGDDNSIAIWIILLVVAFIGIVGIVVGRRKRKSDSKKC